MISIFEFKKHIANICIFDIIIIELSHWKKVCPVILLKINKSSKISFHCTILLFGLTIYLRIKGGKKPFLDTKRNNIIIPKNLRWKKSLISDNQVWKAVVPHHYVNNNFCQAFGINNNIIWLIINYFMGQSTITRIKL